MASLGKLSSCTQKSLQAAEIEPTVWAFVSDLLMDPEKIRVGIQTLIEQEQASEPQDLERGEGLDGKDGRIYPLKKCLPGPAGRRPYDAAEARS